MSLSTLAEISSKTGFPTESKKGHTFPSITFATWLHENT